MSTGSTTRSLGANNNNEKKIIQAQKQQAEFVSTSNSTPGPGISNLPITVDLEPLLYGIAENSLASRTTFTRLYRDMYYYDAICGTTVDLYSSLPFSEFTLGGIKETNILDLYYENIERLNIRTLLNELSIDYLVTGTFLGSLLYNKEKKLFFDIMPHDIGNADIIPMPFYSQDPIITMKFPIEVQKALNSGSKRIEIIKEKLGHTVIEKLMSGSIELDPIGTIYLPRKTFSNSEGTSFYKRVLPIYLIEKNLFRGTLLESAKRQRGILHVTIGDGDQWEPTQGDMESITELFMCLSGDSMLHTDQGLKRLDSICDRKGMAKDTHQKIDLNLKGADGKMCKATKWWYRGYAPTVKVSTEYGYHIKGTEDHRVYVLSEKGPHWKKIKNLKFTDYLCIDKKQVEQKSNPKLDWGNVEINCHDTNSKVVTLPSRMTLEFAYLLGLAIAEGDFSQDGIRLGNTDLDILNKYVKCFKTLGLPADYVKNTRQLAGTVVKFGETESIRKRDYYNVIGTNSRVLMRYFANLGIECNDSFSQEIPQVVLDASTDCQASFLAGLVDGDGSLVDGQYRIYSRSKKLLNQLQSLLSNFGIISCVNQDYPFINLSAHHSQILASYVNEHLACKYKKLKIGKHSCKKSGVPTHWLHTILKARHIERKDGGEWFYDDNDQPVFIKNFGTKTNRCFGAVVGKGNLRKGRLIKDTYESGKYDEAFEALRIVSASAYNKLISLFEANYNFFKVESLTDCGKKHVYDLTISNASKPAFIVNGILVHNSADADPLGAIITTRLGISTEEIRQGGEFWKYTDISDQTAALKLKAMGISDSFLGGDATLNCVIGPTLIPTSNGLQRIGGICNLERGKIQTVYFDVGSRFTKERATKWIYSGEHQTISVTAESGNNVTGTYKHKLLVLRDGILDWVMLRDIKLTDYLCLNPISATREHDYVAFNNTVVIDYRMAYLIGCLLKKGYAERGTLKLLLTEDCAAQFADYFGQLFFKVAVSENRQKFCITIEDSDVIGLFSKLVGNKNILPWSVCKTSREAQLSFVAAMVDTSSIAKITFDSPSFGKELQCLLNSLGIMCDLRYNYLVLPEGEDYTLYHAITDYCATKYAIHYQPRKWYGVPMEDGSIMSYDDIDPISEAHEHKYRFVKVVSIKDAGIQKVYDLSINPLNPSYIANGLVSHNTTEASLSVFIEQLRAYRDRITRKLLYNKVFPLISMVNGLSIKNGRISRSDKVLDVENALDIMQDGSKLVIPIVHWNKQLKPEGDTAYLDLLDRMTAAGVPVPLRAMAAAGGFNLDELIAQQDDDLNIRERIKEYVDKLSKFKAASEEEGGGSGEAEASVALANAELELLDADPRGKYYSSVLGSGSGKKNLLGREFDPEIVGETKTGKKKIILDQVGANKKANSNIVKAVKSIAKNKKTPLSHKTTTEKKKTP